MNLADIIIIIGVLGLILTIIALAFGIGSFKAKVQYVKMKPLEYWSQRLSFVGTVVLLGLLLPGLIHNAWWILAIICIAIFLKITVSGKLEDLD